MTRTGPLADASKRLQRGELPPEQAARAQRERERADRARVREQEQRQRDQESLDAARRENELYWAFREWMMTRRPEPPAVPVPDEPRYNIFDRTRTHGYGSPVRRTRFP